MEIMAVFFRNVHVVRVFIQVLVSLSLLSLAFLLFGSMDLLQSYYYEGGPSKSHPQATSTAYLMSSPPSKKNLSSISMTLSQAIGQEHALNATGGAKPSINRTRYLIYLCDQNRLCGGLGDRQIGLVAASVLAIVTGRKFGIRMSYPCDIKQFYIPNEINWYIKASQIKGLSREVVDWIDNYRKVIDCESDFNTRHPSDVVYLRNNQDIIPRLTRSPRYGHLVPPEYRDSKTAWQIGWHKLMKPSFHMQEHIDNLMATVPDTGDFVCAHIRIRKNPSIPNDAIPLNSLSSIESLWTFLSKYETNASRIFIATDSMEVRASARKRIGKKELDINGLILHIDRQAKRNDACLGFKMAVLDQAILTKCKVLVMTASGFSIRASMMSRRKQKLFMFTNGRIR